MMSHFWHGQSSGSIQGETSLGEKLDRSLQNVGRLLKRPEGNVQEAVV